MPHLRQVVLQTARDIFYASTRFPLTEAGTQVEIAAQHRRVGAYRLWKFHCHGANSILYGADTRYHFLLVVAGTEVQDR